MDKSNSITIEPFVDIDGVLLGFDFRCGADKQGFPTGIHVPVPSLENPHGKPQVYFLGEEGWPLEDLQGVLLQLETILTSSVFIEALERFERESGAAQLQAAKRLIRWHSPRTYKCRG